MEGREMEVKQRLARELDIDPFSNENLADPYPFYEVVRDAGPVVELKQYPDVVACGRHADLQAVLSDPATFISGAGNGMTNLRKDEPFRERAPLIDVDPPDHTKARAVLTKILSPAAVARMRAVFFAEAEELVDRCLVLSEAQAGLDGIRDLARAYPLKVFPDAVGIETEGRDNLLAYTDMAFNSLGPKNALLHASAKDKDRLTAWVMAHCQSSHLRHGSFGDLIYQAAAAGEIDAKEAPLLVRSFLAAGVDTTVAAIGNVLELLAENPAACEQLHSNPALARNAFEEGLRLETPAQMFFRTTARDCQIGGSDVRAEVKVMCLVASANRDPRKWSDPDRFDLNRRPAGHLAFGSGIHNCIGQIVARVEGEAVLSAIAKRVQRIERTGVPTRHLNNTVRSLATLPIRFVPA